MTVQQGQILQHYQTEIANGNLTEDVAQRAAITALDQLSQLLTTPSHWWQRAKPIKGVYLYGPVGRGKSMLMDIFYQRVSIEGKIRLHFHHFMKQVHERLSELQGQKNPLNVIAKEWAEHIRLICFDEFFVSDIGDAMILGGLFKALFAQQVVLVATSNCQPEQLYRNGLQRARFLPTIDLLNDHCHILSVEGHTDHRFRFGKQTEHYFIDNKEALTERFLKQEQAIQRQTTIEVCHRKLSCVMQAQDAIMFDFMTLCSGPRSTADYIYLAECFQRVYLLNVPVMGRGATGKQIVHGIEDSYQREKQDLQEHFLDDEARRFIALVDEFYDRNRLLVISAELGISDLYQGQKLAFEYARTESRLVEMQSWKR
ncbi:cell division protein ZapE [Pseudoalteromonas sp. SSMSWG5]|uniref:cell division protein ZapE n=1 Tax=Pseudoalteromonas sp. SSMSWG5 TaxID=3139396 RepID=UPI003BA8E7AF